MGALRCVGPQRKSPCAGSGPSSQSQKVRHAHLQPLVFEALFNSSINEINITSSPLPPENSKGGDTCFGPLICNW